MAYFKIHFPAVVAACNSNGFRGENMGGLDGKYGKYLINAAATNYAQIF